MGNIIPHSLQFKIDIKWNKQILKIISTYLKKTQKYHGPSQTIWPLTITPVQPPFSARWHIEILDLAGAVSGPAPGLSPLEESWEITISSPSSRENRCILWRFVWCFLGSASVWRPAGQLQHFHGPHSFSVCTSSIQYIIYSLYVNPIYIYVIISVYIVIVAFQSIT